MQVEFVEILTKRWILVSDSMGVVLGRTRLWLSREILCPVLLHHSNRDIDTRNAHILER